MHGRQAGEGLRLTAERVLQPPLVRRRRLERAHELRVVRIDLAASFCNQCFWTDLPLHTGVILTHLLSTKQKQYFVELYEGFIKCTGLPK